MSAQEPTQVFGPRAGLITLVKFIMVSPMILIGVGSLSWFLNFFFAEEVQAIPADFEWIVFILSSILIVSIPLALWLAWEHLKWKVVEYRLYDDKFEVERGVLNKTYQTASWSEVTDITKNRDAVERILGGVGYGIADIDISTAGQDGAKFKLRYVERPSRLYNTLSGYIDQSG